MPSIYNLKTSFQHLLRPIVNWLAAHRITANQITIMALLLSSSMGTAIVYYGNQLWIFWLLPLVLFVRMALNAIDGMLAREHHMISSLGVVLNEIGDVVSDTALYLPLALLPQFSAHLIVTVVVLALLTEMMGIVAVQIGASRRYDGPMGKSDRAFVFGAISLSFALDIRIASWINPILWVMVLLLVITLVNRATRALLEVKDVKRDSR